MGSCHPHSLLCQCCRRSHQTSSETGLRAFPPEARAALHLNTRLCVRRRLRRSTHRTTSFLDLVLISFFLLLVLDLFLTYSLFPHLLPLIFHNVFDYAMIRSPTV